MTYDEVSKTNRWTRRLTYQCEGDSNQKQVGIRKLKSKLKLPQSKVFRLLLNRTLRTWSNEVTITPWWVYKHNTSPLKRTTSDLNLPDSQLPLQSSRRSWIVSPACYVKYIHHIIKPLPGVVPLLSSFIFLRNDGYCSVREFLQIKQVQSLQCDEGSLINLLMSDEAFEVATLSDGGLWIRPKLFEIDENDSVEAIT